MIVFKNSACGCKWLFITLSLIFSLPLLAICDWKSIGVTAEMRVAYYHPYSSLVRRIYGNGWADYQLELSAPIAYNWKICTGISGFSREGESIGLNDPTRLQLIPLNLGLKVFFPLFDCVNFYLGGAVCYSSLNIKDDSEHNIHRHIRRQGLGGLLQSGVTYRFWREAYVSLFADYFFQKFHFSKSKRSHHYVERIKLDMSGYKMGVGLGMVF